MQINEVEIRIHEILLTSGIHAIAILKQQNSTLKLDCRQKKFSNKLNLLKI